MMETQTSPTAASIPGSSHSTPSAGRQVMQVYVGSFSNLYEALSIEASKQTTAEEIVECIAEKLGLKESSLYELAEVVGNDGGQDCKERRIGLSEFPVALQLLWPKPSKPNGRFGSISGTEYRFCLRRKMMQSMNWSFSWTDSNDSQLLKDYFLRFLYQPRDREYPDLCQLPDLTEQTLLENLKARFEKGHIYTYVGSILIALNPFKFYPIYNPKYVQLYQNRRLGDLPPHIFAIADAAYQSMLKKRCNQCIVISGESGSGKTESTNFLLHHLTALSQKGSHGSGVEQTILGAGPVLEAFGNAKTKFNNNSSRFGKFIQVNYKENGMVHGAIVQKYLLEKSRIVSHAKNERNYHVFYYMLAGCTQEEKDSLHLTKASDYFYLNQSKCYSLEGVDEAYELSRLKQSLEMVGFSIDKQRRLMSLLAAVLHLGNVDFAKKSAYHNDETVMVKNTSVVTVISSLLQVREEDLLSALTCKKTKAAKGETIVIHYKHSDAIATRDAMAKCLYGALFDWIVMQVNSSLLGKQDVREHRGNYIGVLDIFGFEDFGDQNYFEQFCINFANEHLHFYFNQHVFKYEQEEYKREGINWKNIDFHDNIGCLNLIQGRPHGLLCLLDDQCNFPGASDETVLQKFVNHHNDNPLFEVPPCRQSAFVIKHYAGKVKYQIRDFREKNMDLMRPDIVSLLKSSSSSFVRELVGLDPLALFRWQILKAFFKAYYIFSKLREESRSRREAEGPTPSKNNNNKTGTNIQMLTRKLGIECISRETGSKSINGMNQVMRKPGATCIRGSLLRVASYPDYMHVYDRANQVFMKNKVNRIPSLKKSPGIEKSVKNFKNLRIIAGRSFTIQGPPRAGRKTTQTVTFQFQQSLNALMETLNQANPFFVRCIKSNADKLPGVFDDMLVLVQLRYTGMLDTVKIRQSGYSVRLSFDEFIQHYRILLPRGLTSSQTDIRNFLNRMNLNRDNYQMGNSKIFMRESEKLVLDNMLHREILQRIITLQRWIRTWITRRRFLQMRDAAICIQKHARRLFAQQRLARMRDLVTCEKAATTIQKTWKSFRERASFVRLREATLNFQAHARGYLCRKDFQKRKEERRLPKHQRLERLDRSRTPSIPTQSLDSTSLTQVTDDNSTTSTTTVTYPTAPSVPPEPIQLVRTRLSSGSVTASGSEVPQSPTLKSFREDYSVSTPRSSVPGRMSMSSDSSNFVTSSPPPLPPRRTSQNTFNFPSTSRRSLTEQMSAPVGLSKDDTEVNKDLNRRPSRPLTRRLSFKNSFSNSPSSSQEKDDVFASEVSRIPASSSFPSSTTNNNQSFVEVTESAQKSKGIKTRLKMMIIGGSKDRGNKENNEDSFFTSRDGDSFETSQVSSQSRKNSKDTPVSSPASLDAFSGDPLISPLHAHDVEEYVGTKNDACFVCQNGIHGKNSFKCIGCNFIFHKKCFSLAADFPCLKQKSGGFGPSLANKPPSSSNRKQGSRKDSSGRRVSGGRSREGSQTTTSSWSVTRTTEFTDPKDVLIGDVSELHYLETFLNKKIDLMEDSRKFSNKESQVDVVFMSALKEFKKNLISTYSVASQDPHHMHISYKNLIDHFEQVMLHVCQRENTFKSFPVTMGVNAFRGFLDEFRNLVVKSNLPEKTKTKTPNKRRRNKLSKKIKEENIQSVGHIFRPVQANIPTVCEVCSSLMWLMEKVWVCQGCKLTCHKKCCAKVIVSCRMEPSSGNKESPSGCFGVPIERLVDEEHRVPKVIEDLMTAIELKGLYTEGLYRKSGTTSKINEVKMKLDQSQVIDLDSYSIHVLTGVLKSFLREMPDPLMTFEFYDDFLWATTTTDPQERVQAIYSHISKLPRPHYDLLERLSFHLARVAQHEHANRMNANSLAIVLAPCVLRTDRPMQMQDKLSDIGKQTVCLQTIIGERLRQVCDTLADIDILDNAFRTASSRLSSIRQSKLQLNLESTRSPTEEEEEEHILKEQLETLRSEKAHLTNMLPTFRLASSGSEEDLLNVDMDTSTVGSSLEPDSASPVSSKPFSLTTHSMIDENLIPSSRDLRHLTKNRAPKLTNRRLPSRFTSDGLQSEQPSTSCRLKANTSKRLKPESSASQIEEHLFSPEDQPVTV